MSEPSSFYHQLDDNETSSADLCPPEVEIPEEADDDPAAGTGSSCIEFGFEVNVLDLICQKNQQHVASDDEAIVSFGNTINVLPVQQVPVEPEVAVEFHQEILEQEENYEDDNDNTTAAADDHGAADYAGSDHHRYSVTGNEPSAVKIIPNYAQIVQYMAKSWRTVEQELEKGLAQHY